MNPGSPSRSASPASDVSQDPQSRGDRRQAGKPRGVCVLLRIDGVFEAVLGAFLILCSATSLSSVLDLPYPATKPVVVIVGLFLLPLFPILWWISRASQRWTVQILAGANGAGAIIFSLWVLIWNRAFNTAGAALVLTVAGILAVLAVLQARSSLGAALL